MIKPAQKISIVFHKENRRNILKFLQNKEIVEFIKERESGKYEENAEIFDRKIEIHTKLAEAEYAINFLLPWQSRNEKKSLRERMQGLFASSKIYLAEKTVEKRVEEFNLFEVVDRCKELEARINELNNFIDDLTRKERINHKWIDFPYDLSDLDGLKNLKMIVCSTVNLEKVNDAIKKETNLHEIKEISRISSGKVDNVKFCLFYHPEEEEKIKKILESCGAENQEEVMRLKNLPRMEIKKIKARLAKYKKEKKDIIKEMNKLFFSSGRDLKMAHDYLNWKEKRIEAILQGNCTDCAVCVKAWIDPDRIKELEEGLFKVTKNFQVFELKTGEKEQPPVIVKRKRFLTPVEAVMNLYGMPKEDEVDPLPLMAPFFILFFAICLGDVGYGFFMFLLPLLAIKAMRIPVEGRGFLHLLMYLGLASCVTGALFGGWFGADLDKLSSGPIKDALLTLRITDPLNDPMQILFFALGLGILQVMFGIFIKMYWTIKTRNVKEGLLDGLPWLYFITAILLYAAAGSKLIPLGMDFAKYLVFAGVLFLVLTQGRKNKNIFKKIFGGVSSLYGLVGYFSDVVSYSRLLALGLATGVIAAVVNMIADMVGEMIPVVGAIASIVVLVFGHAFNLLISGFGAFIHSMRLQFVEFLPKFMAGGGKKFNSFKKEEKYVEISSNK